MADRPLLYTSYIGGHIPVHHHGYWRDLALSTLLGISHAHSLGEVDIPSHRVEELSLVIGVKAEQEAENRLMPVRWRVRLGTPLALTPSMRVYNIRAPEWY